MGAWVGWKQMTTAQRLAATNLRPAWPLHQFRDFDFYIRKDGHVSQAKGGGAHSLSDQAAHRLTQEIIDRPTRTKGDMCEWKPGVTFHLDKTV